jgi:hypothetical protein
MPRRSRVAKKRRSMLPGIRQIEVVDWLLLGRLRQPAELSEEARNSYDAFREFDPDWPPENLSQLWRTHRSVLLVEAKRRGIAQPWGLRFDSQ